MDIDKIIAFLKTYDGPELRIMEVCGTHTSAIFKTGIRSMISPAIRLISGPGCPVCVTPSSYIDRCLEYAFKPGYTVLSFGDMFKVPGITGSLAVAKGEGGKAELMYSPMEALEKAVANPDTQYVVAAVGFETTAVSYALLVEEIVKRNIGNIKLLTALKTVIPALEMIAENDDGIDGFICPGHVSVIIGAAPFKALASRYKKPFVIAGFQEAHLLAAILAIVKTRLDNDSGKVEHDLSHLSHEAPYVKMQPDDDSGKMEHGLSLLSHEAPYVKARPDNDSDKMKATYINKDLRYFNNLYPAAVKPTGNLKAQMLISKYFRTGAAKWRGIGEMPSSGLYLRDEYTGYDCGSHTLYLDREPEGCRCGEVIMGKINPPECQLFGTMCTPERAIGPCMVTAEGACGIWCQNV